MSHGQCCKVVSITILVHIIIISLPTFRTSQEQCRSWHTVAYEAPRRTPFSPDDYIVHDGYEDDDHDKKQIAGDHLTLAYVPQLI